MTDFVRRIVSGAKARHVDSKLGFDLDLVYVTDRLIIMGWPASSIEALYRNRRKDVRKFLDAKHGEKYRIYNLCPCSENTYDANEFYGAVSRYPFPDHHPPPLSMIPMFVADLTAWLAEDLENVAVIHCKAGKGRSGTMACSYLLSLPVLPPSPQDPRNLGNKYDRAQYETQRKARSSARAREKEEMTKMGTLPNENLLHPSQANSRGSSPSRDARRSSGETEIPPATKIPGLDRQRPTTSWISLKGKKSSIDHVDMVCPQTIFDDKRAAIATDIQAEKLAEMTRRLNAVFEFHTSRRLKPAKSSTNSPSSSSPVASRKSSMTLKQWDDSAVATEMGRGASSDSNLPRPVPPPRQRSFSNLVGTISRKASRIALTATDDDESKRGYSESSTDRSASRLGSKSGTNLRALGASPAGRSCHDLSLPEPMPALTSSLLLRPATDEPNATTGSFRTMSAGEKTGNGSHLSTQPDPLMAINTTRSPSPIEKDGKAGERAFIVSPLSSSPPRVMSPSSLNTKSGESPPQTKTNITTTATNRLESGDDYAGEEGEEYEEGETEPTIPRLAVSIPSQRRFVGYWTRILAGMDPRAALDHTLIHPKRRTVRVTRILIDRRSMREKDDEKGEDGHLSVQISRYKSDLVERVEDWERRSRRRQRAFGALDPREAAPHLLPPEYKDDDEALAKADKNLKKELWKEDHDRRWKDAEEKNQEHRREYDLKLRQHGNDTGVGQWGINVMAEKETARCFCWHDEKDGKDFDQMETLALVSEVGREMLSPLKAEGMSSNLDLTAKATATATTATTHPILRYAFEPGKSTYYGDSTPRPTWTKPSSANARFNKILRGIGGGQRRSSSTTPQEQSGHADPHPLANNSTSDSSNDISLGRASHSTAGLPAFNNSPPSSSEEEDVLEVGGKGSDGLTIDADREVLFKVLLGRTGATHSMLPDMLSAGYLWFIPAFETPLLSGESKPKKGQVVQCQFGIGEIDFRKKGKASSLMGGGDIRNITVEFEWVEVGWHEADEESDEEEEVTL